METNENKTFHSNGKLMLAGEYAVIADSKALAASLSCGQSLSVSFNSDGPHEVLWKTFEGESQTVEFNFPIEDIDQKRYKPEGERGFLLLLLRAARRIDKRFLAERGLYVVESTIETGLKPGMGMSSSLISNIAFWANVNPYRLNRIISKGSGYDVAAARSSGIITYRKNCNEPEIQTVSLPENILNKLFLVHLNEKENTEKSISLYLNLLRTKKKAILSINEIIDKMLKVNTVEGFGGLMEKHDLILAKILSRKTAKQIHFSNFNGWIKSSGAWGGDYVLALSEDSDENVKKYFVDKGFKSVIKLNELL